MRTLISSLLLILALPASAQVAGVAGSSRNIHGQIIPNPKPGGGGFDYDLANYTAARAQTCSVGETAEIDGPDAVARSYDCVNDADGWRGFDDGLLDIDTGTAGNLWKLDFAHSDVQPIELGAWDDLAQNARIDTLLENIATDLAPNLYVELPAASLSVDTLTWDFADFTTAGTTRFYLMENDGAIVIDHTGTTDADKMADLDNYVQVLIGGDNLYLTFNSNHPGSSCPYPLDPPGEKCVDATPGGGTPSEGVGLWEFNQGTTNGQSFTWKANVTDAPGWSFRHTGGNFVGSTQRTNQVTVEGTFINGGTQLGSGVKNFDVNATYEDHHAVGQGWEGSGTTNDCGLNDGGGDEKNQGLWFQNMDDAEGSITLRYGWSRWFSEDVTYVGNSESDRFVIILDSLGYTGPRALTEGQQVATAGCTMQGGKMDDWSNDLGDGSVSRWLDVSEETGSKFALDYEIIVNASSGIYTCCTDIQYSNMLGSTIFLKNGNGYISVPWPNGVGDEVENIVYQGGATANAGVLRLSIGDRVTGTGTFTDIEIEDTRGQAYTPTSNTIEHITVTGDIYESSTPTGTTTLDSVTVQGTTVLTFLAAFSCTGQGNIAAGTYDMSVAGDRTTVGATGSDPYVICDDASEGAPGAFTFTVDGDGTIASEVARSSGTGTWTTHISDDPTSSSADYLYSNASADGSFSAWFSLADMASGFTQMDALDVQVDVEASGFSNDQETIYIQIFDGNESATNLTDEESVGTQADGTRTQRTVSFSGVTASDLTTWNGAYARVRWDFNRVAGDDNAQMRLYGVKFTGTDN